ncbi:MAG: urate hydroxylase PuuD [Rhodocyclales bacterium]|nr:urate hydroxylase PuuD [Rhodocyclales bacterium]
MESYFLDWANLLVRWLHLITGIAWIGASFYFVMLDNSLKPPKTPADTERGVFGELWAVHGGGFYRSQKFLTGPRGEPLSDDLHWSKWEAYTTWLSGMGLLALVYWVGASSYLIDRNVMALEPAGAIAISIAFLAVGWLVYDGLCRVLVGKDGVLAALVFVFVVACDWALFQVFSARGAYIHVGAMIGTMMVANVFFHIIPGQRRMVAQIRAGTAVDPRPGVIGKQRSVHNTYFTLPVLFIMISNHYPMTYSHPQGWLVLVLIMLAGVLIRQFYVLRHRGQVKWWLPAAGVVLLGAVAVWLAPERVDASGAKVGMTEVTQVLRQRCVACHAAQPTHEGFAQPPKGVVLETPEQIAQHAAKIAETVANGYMPLANLTGMSDAERRLIATWMAQGAGRIGE